MSIANVNGKILSSDELKSVEGESENKKLGDVRDLFASRAMAHRTLVSWYSWYVGFKVYNRCHGDLN